MKKNLLIISVLTGNLLLASSVQADYISEVRYRVLTYGLGSFNIPDTVGGVTEWYDNSSISFSTVPSVDRGSFFELIIDGSRTGDNVTWKTNNPGIGIQYMAKVSSTLFSPSSTEIAPNYRLNLNLTEGTGRSSSYHVYYRLVRLSEKVPSGKITSLPSVTLNAYNPDKSGPGMLSGQVLSGIISQPKITACTIDAPTEIKLSPLYGNSLVNGAQNPSATQSITLLNCPGAIDNITYTYHAVYGTHDVVNGVLNTSTGADYAKNVYIQMQNADGTAHAVDNIINLKGYDGSGNYTLPDFKVAYFIDDVNSVTAGNVKSAIEIQLQYN